MGGAYEFIIADRPLSEEHTGNELGRKSISVVGRGTQGTIYAESKTIEFNNVLVNTQEERHVQLFNPSDCDVKYHLELTRVLREETETNAADGEAIPVANEIVLPNQLRHAQITVNQTSGIISSRSHQIVKVRVGLRYSKHYEFRLYCKIEKDSLATVSRHASKTTAVHQEGSIRTLLCTVTADGVFPSLQITDARSEGHSKNSLWHRLSLMQLNEALSSHDIREEKLPTPLTSSSTNKENIGGHVANALARKKSDSTLPATFASQSYLFDFGAQIAE